MGSAEYLKLNVRLLQFGGLYKVRHPAMLAWKFYCNFSFCYFVAASFVDVMQNASLGFDAIAINCVNIGVGAMVTLRTNCFYVTVDKSERLVEDMNRVFKSVSETGLVEKSMEARAAFTVKMTLAFWASACVLGEGYAVAKMLRGGFENRVLPYPMWYPFDWKQSPAYEIICVQQLVCHTMLIQFQCAADMFYASLVLLTIRQFELLGWEFRNVVYTGLLEFGVPKVGVVRFKEQFESRADDSPDDELEGLLEMVVSEKFNRHLERKLKRLIESHQNLTSFCELLENFFSPLLLIYTVVFVVIALFSLYYMIMTDDRSVRIVFGGYMVLIPGDIILTCLIGQLLTTQTEQLQNDLYEMPWYLCHRIFKKTFMIVHHRAMEPVQLTIGRFARLNLNTSVWIMRTAFSYATILRQMTE